MPPASSSVQRAGGHARLLPIKRRADFGIAPERSDWGKRESVRSRRQMTVLELLVIRYRAEADHGILHTPNQQCNVCVHFDESFGMSRWMCTKTIMDCFKMGDAFVGAL